MTAAGQHDHRSEQILQVFRLYGSLMFRIAFSILKQEQDAEDAVQETLLKLLEKAEALPLHDPGAIRPMIFVLTRNTAVDMRRRRQRFVSADMNEEETQISLSLAESDSEKYQAHALAEQIRRLPESEQELLWMRFWEGLTYGQIAAQLGITGQAANSRVRRVLAHLKAIYEGEENEKPEL